MNAKTLTRVAIAAVVLLLVAILLTTLRAPETELDSTRALAPQLEDALNEVTQVTLIKAGETPVATLQRGEQHWTVAEKNDYPADMSQIRKLLLGLAEAKLLEEKTAKPALYDRLGVRAVSDPDAGGVRVEITGPAEPLSLIIGEFDSRSGSGTYVRRAEEAQTWLASGNLSVEQDTVAWLEREIMDIPTERLQQVTIRHPDDDTLVATKVTRKQTNFIVPELPAGRELQSTGAVDALANALTVLRLEDVAPAAEFDPAAQDGIDIEYRAFDGLVIEAVVFEREDKRYVHFNARFDAEQAQRFAASPEAETAEAGADDTAETAEVATTEPAIDEEELKNRQKDAEKMDARLNRWVYVLPSYKYDNMTKRLEDLLKQVEETAAAEPAPAQEMPVAESVPTPAAAEPPPVETAPAAEMVEPATEPAASTTVETGEPAAEPEMPTATETVEPATEPAASAVVEPSEPAAAEATGPATASEASEAVETGEPAAEPEIPTATETVEPATEPAASEAVETGEPAAEPEMPTATETVEPTTEPAASAVVEPSEPAAAPAASKTVEPVE